MKTGNELNLRGAYWTYAKLEDEEPPSKYTLILWLKRAECDGLVECPGCGRNRDPYQLSVAILIPKLWKDTTRFLF